MTAEPSPDPSIVRRRISSGRAEWARQADWIIGEYGAVCCGVAYPTRHQARWKARYLIGLLVELGLRSRNELVEHTERRRDGEWEWAVEIVV